MYIPPYSYQCVVTTPRRATSDERTIHHVLWSFERIPVSDDAFHRRAHMNDLFLNQLLSLPTVRRFAMSPDRRWIAFSWYRIHPNTDVFVVPSDGSALPVVLTSSDEDTEFVGWTPDSTAIIVAEDHDGDERTRLFRVAIDRPGVMEALTEDRPPYFMRGGSLLPDGHTLIYGMNFDVTAGVEIEPNWVYRHDLRTGERTPIARPERAAWGAPSPNRQGTHILYVRQDRHPAGQQVWLVGVDGQDDREILNFGDDCKVEARWFPDGEHILVVSEATSALSQSHSHRSLGIYNWRHNDMRWIVDHPERNIEDAWVTPDGTIVIDEVRGAEHIPSFYDADAGIETAFPHVAGNLIPVGRAVDDTWIAVQYAATMPPDLVRCEAGASGVVLQSLTGLWQRTPLDRTQLTPAEHLRWRSDDGMEIQGWLYRARPNPRRAIIYIHGGPTAMSEDIFNPEVQYYVSLGFNVLDVNYRGSTGFGLPFQEAIKQDGWGGREQIDIATGARALIAAGLAEPGRVGVTGTSYGGYSSWFLITHQPPDVIAAAAPICGMTDLVVDYNTTRPDLRPYSEEMIGGTPDQMPGRYFERSPINFVENIRGRLLIVQGLQDPNVTPDNVRVVVERLDDAHIAYEVLQFADEGHGIGKPANQKILFQRLGAFFDAALGSHETSKDTNASITRE